MCDKAFNTPDEQAAIDKGKLPRVASCHKTPMLDGYKKAQSFEGVEVRKHLETGSVSFAHLLTCGSVWVCPICAAKVSERRCDEIAGAFEIWRNRDKGNTQIMVSFTIPHYAHQSIEDLRKIFMKARRLMKQQKVLKRKPLKVYSSIVEQYGIKGCVSGIEVTWGFNGWHPHSHDIYFVDHDFTDDELNRLQLDLSHAWIYACDRAKLEVSDKTKCDMLNHAVDVRRAKTAAEYIAKFGEDTFKAKEDILNPGWGASQEITKSHIKVSRGKDGLTPWNFLSIISETNDRGIYLKFGRLFREYARAFHGKRQLFWSKGFKAELGIQELTDEELAADSQEEITESIGTIPPEVWVNLVHYKLRGWALYMARELNISSKDDFQGYLEVLRGKISTLKT